MYKSESPARKSRLAFLLLATAFSSLALVSLLPAAVGDTIADRVLGQPDFVHRGTNTLDGAVLAGPHGVAIDRSSVPNHLYVADSTNNRVLGWRDATSFTDGAAADVVIGQKDFSGSGFGSGAGGLSDPLAVAVDTHGNLYVADSTNNRVLEYDAPIAGCNGSFPCVGAPAAVVFGQLANFSATGCNFGAGASAGNASADSLCSPNGVALDSHNNLYIADAGNNRVLEYNETTNPPSNLTANLVFGQGAGGNNFTANQCNINGTTINQTSLCNSEGLALDSANNLYIADTGNRRVLEFNEGANPPTNVSANVVFGQLGSFNTNTCDSGGINGSSLCTPVAVAVDPSNNLYIDDQGRNRVLEYTTPLVGPNTTAGHVIGQADNLAGSSCNLAGTAASADTLCAPQSVAVDTSGDLFIADTNNNRVTGYNTPLTTDTVADRELGQTDFAHRGADPIDGAVLDAPHGVAVDRNSVPNHLYVADSSNNRVLGWRNASSFSNGAAADLVIGQADFGSSVQSSGAGGLSNPMGVAVDSHGNLYVADNNNSRVLEYNAPIAGCGGTFPCVGAPAAVVFGQLGDFSSSGCNFGAGAGAGDASADSLCNPDSVALDSHNNLYVADSGNNRVLEFNEGANPPTNLTANLVFGQGAGGASFAANQCNISGATINQTSLCNPESVAVDGSNNLYVADTTNRRVLEYNEAANPPTNVSANMVFGQLGSFNTNTCDDGGTISANNLCSPAAVALDAGNDLYIGDSSRNRVLEYAMPLAPNTTANHVIGQADNFKASSCNLGSSGPSADTLCQPLSVAVDASGDLFIVDNNNNRVTEYDMPPTSGPTPTATPTVSATPTATRTATPTLTATATATATASNTPTATATPTVTATATMTATATPTPVAGKLKITPKKLSFGTIAVNTSSTKTLKISNAGKISKKKHPLPILIETESTSGAPAPNPFSFTMECTNDDLQPGGKGVQPGSCTVGVKFTPTQVGAYTGQLMIIDNLEPSGMQIVPMTGKGK